MDSTENWACIFINDFTVQCFEENSNIFIYRIKIDVISVFESHDSVAALWKGITQLTVIG